MSDHDDRDDVASVEVDHDGNDEWTDADAELPCWPCYRDGFDVPNPSAGEK